VAKGWEKSVQVPYTSLWMYHFEIVQFGPFPSVSVCARARERETVCTRALPRVYSDTAPLGSHANVTRRVRGRTSAPSSLTVRDVKSAWRSRWLRHRSLGDFKTSTLNMSVCLRLVFSRAKDRSSTSRNGRPRCAVLRGCNIPGASRRPGGGWPWWWNTLNLGS